MVNIYEILQRAASLKEETVLNSISPERAGGIMYDTLLALNDLWLQQGSALVISKIYASVAAMEADTAPVSDLTGKPLRPGQIVVIASSDSDNGSVYRYNGTDAPSWSLVGAIGNLTPVDSLDSDSTQLPLAAHQGKVLDGKISQLGQKVGSVEVVQSLSISKRFDLVWTKNKCIQQDGSVRTGMSDDVYVSEKYIPVKSGQVLYLNLRAPGATDVCAWYDTAFAFISYFTVSSEASKTVTVPQDGYLRVSNEIASVASPYIELRTSSYLSNNELVEQIIDLPAYDQNIGEVFDFPLQLVWEEGRTLNASGVPAFNNSNYAFTPDYHFSFPGQKFNINTKGTGTALAIAFYDKDKTFLSGATNIGGATRLDVIAPENTRYVRFGTEDKSFESVLNVHTKTPFADSGDFDNLSEKVGSIADYTGYSLDSVDVLPGLLQKADGQPGLTTTTNPNYRYCPDYFPVQPGRIISTSAYATVTYAGVCFYKNDKTFLSSASEAVDYVVPADAAFVRICTERYTTNGLTFSIGPAKTIPGTTNYPKPFYAADIDKYDTATDFSGQQEFTPTSGRIEHKYIGQVSPEKRFMCVGFDDFRETDFNTIMPLFEKYGFVATFNRIARDVKLSADDKKKLNQLITGGHELGDHSWLHECFAFADPMFNGQDPSSPDGSQVPFPSNSQMRDNRGDGKNVFGIDLATPASTTLGGWGPGIETAWGSLSDTECQTIREWYSVMQDTNSNLIDILDTLSNMFLGTTGSSRGSWNNSTQQYDGGIFTGCKTSANHEIWERYIIVTQMYYKAVTGVNYNIKTWSLPGSKKSNCFFESNGKKYYDSGLTKYANFLAKFSSSTLKNPDGTAKVRSWADCLREFGYNATHDTIWPGRLDGSNGNAYWVAAQFVLNANGRRKDSIPYSSNVTNNFAYQTIETAYPETEMTGTTSLAAQMYDSANSPAFKTFIESARRNMSRGIIDVETADSANTYSFRLFMEGLLKYCKVTGVELVTKQEAFDICFNHSLKCGNLIYNPRLRNTAKEFMPDATTIPDNPDGYEGSCSVSAGTNNTPILVTSGTTQYDHFGIPEGSLVYKAKVKGTGTIKLQTIKNRDSRYHTLNRSVIATENVANADFAEVEIPFSIYEPVAAAYEQVFEGLGDKVIGLGIEYSDGLQVKEIELKLV